MLPCWTDRENTLCAVNYRMDADNCQMKKAATVQTVAAFFSEITMPELHPDKCILGCVANRASPVIRKVFKLLALFRIIINVSANRASPHNNLLRRIVSLFAMRLLCALWLALNRRIAGKFCVVLFRLFGELFPEIKAFFIIVRTRPVEDLNARLNHFQPHLLEGLVRFLDRPAAPAKAAERCRQACSWGGARGDG